jgi:hypothetical protein
MSNELAIPGQRPAPIDNLEAKRQRESFINAHLTLDQQRAIGMILERWWAQKMAGIETGKVIEATEHLPAKMRELEQEIADLRARILHHLP